jgi:hypothetical protein
VRCVPERVTTAEYPRRQSSPAMKNWLAFARKLLSLFSFIIMFSNYAQPREVCYVCLYISRCD